MQQKFRRNVKFPTAFWTVEVGDIHEQTLLPVRLDGNPLQDFIGDMIFQTN
jgi:hypothetical protein